MIGFVLALFVLAAVASLLALLFFSGRRREETIERDWQLVLTPRGQAQLNKFSETVRDELALSDLQYARAKEADARGDLVAARRMVDMGCELIAAFAPRMSNALSGMAALSRMAAAVAPVRPLRAERFQIGQLAQLANIGRLLHHLTVGSADRFRLRVHILRRGFGTVAAVAMRGPVSADMWAEVGALHHDVGVLSDESLVTLRALLVSMDAERRVE